MSDHKHGEMNADEHHKTFEGFVKFLTWSTIAIIVTLLFVAAVGA